METSTHHPQDLIEVCKANWLKFIRMSGWFDGMSEDMRKAAERLFAHGFFQGVEFSFRENGNPLEWVEMANNMSFEHDD